MELSNERYWTTDGKPRDLETSFMQDFFSVLKHSGATTTNSTIVGGAGVSRARDARKRTLTTDSRETQPQSPGGFMRRNGTMSRSSTIAKDDKLAEDSEGDLFGRNTRFRRISFAGDARPQDAGEAV